jgi:5-formyltetrahydrofolate cyclo-ligase
MEDARAEKARLRLELKARRLSLTARELQVAGDACARLIAQLPEWKQAKAVCLYASFGAELSTEALLQIALLEGKILVLPRVAKATTLTLHRVQDVADLRRSKLGILEPADEADEIPLSSVGLVLVPGLGFDRLGHRLGYGAGFYDRLLAKCPKKTFLLGHAHTFQFGSCLPTEPHDIKVKAVATPQGIIRCRVR